MSSRELDERSVDELLDVWEAAWSGKDPDAFDAVCHEDIHYEDPLVAAPLEGPAAVAAHAGRLLATNREPLAGLPATNRFVVVPCVFYCELADARLLRVRAFFDLYDAAVQLGVLPGRGTLGEKALLVLRGFGLRAGR